MVENIAAVTASEERIVAAAIRHGELTISAPPPARHHTLMHPFYDLTLKRITPQNQGFLTNTGRYVGREEAMEIALAASQIDPENRGSGSNSADLFSEDLW